MRSKLIITGAMAVLTAAALTVNAQNAAGRTNASKASTALLAAASVNAHREEVTIKVEAKSSPEVAASATATAEASETPKPDVDAKPAATPGVSTACLTAITNLKNLHQTDVAEDASEHTTGQSETETQKATGDRTEDMTEAQSWAAALVAARTACASPSPARCLPPLAGLQAILQTLRAQEAAEPAGEAMDTAADFSAIRTAVSALAISCPARE